MCKNDGVAMLLALIVLGPGIAGIVGFLLVMLLGAIIAYPLPAAAIVATGAALIYCNR